MLCELLLEGLVLVEKVEVAFEKAVKGADELLLRCGIFRSR